jgi:hypothetical protein
MRDVVGICASVIALKRRAGGDGKLTPSTDPLHHPIKQGRKFPPRSIGSSLADLNVTTLAGCI